MFEEENTFPRLGWLPFSMWQEAKVVFFQFLKAAMILQNSFGLNNIFYEE
jgi:hypothetical protein